MSDPAQALPVVEIPSASPVAAVPATPAPKLTAIQIIEQELGTFFKQHEQAVANVHAVEGAIQAAQHLLAKLKAEATKAEAAVVQEVTTVVDAIKKAL